MRPEAPAIPSLPQPRLWAAALGSAWLTGAVLAAAVLLRVAGANIHWISFDQRHPDTWLQSKLEISQDANQYIQQADPTTWASPLHRDWEERAYFRPPLPSFYFALLFSASSFSRFAVSVAQAALSAFAYLLLFLLLRRAVGIRWANLSLLVLALHPLLIYFDASFEDSTLALLCMTASLLAASWASRTHSVARWAAAGALAGLSALARPNLLVLLVGIAAAALAQAPRPRPVALLAYAAAAGYVLAPAVWHNHSVTGRWTLIADSLGQNLYWGNGPFPDHRFSVQGYWGIRAVDFGSPAALLVQGLKDRTEEESAEGAYRAAVLDFAREHPAKVASELFRKAWRHVSDYEIPRNTNFETIRAGNPIWRLPLVPFGALLGLSLFGCAAVERRARWLLLLPWIASVLSELAFFSAGRYRALGIPFLVPLALAGLHRVAQALLQHRPLAALGLAAPAIALLLLGRCAVSPGDRQRYRAIDLFKDAMLESYADERGQWRRFSEERFLAFLSEARRLDPRNLDAFSVEQKYLIQQRRLAEAGVNIEAHCRGCSPDDWLCQDVCASLRRSTESGLDE